MIYRRNSYRQRKYTYSEPVDQNSEFKNELNKSDIQKKITDIPLPNEIELPLDMSDNSERSRRPGIIEFFKERIDIEFIIIAGLIILLIYEGMDGIEDEFLLLMLIYILLT